MDIYIFQRMMLPLLYKTIFFNVQLNPRSIISTLYTKIPNLKMKKAGNLRERGTKDKQRYQSKLTKPFMIRGTSAKINIYFFKSNDTPVSF